MTSTTPLLSPRAHARIRAVSTLTTILVALAAAVLSWHGLTLLGHQAGFGQLSVLLPIVIDGAMVGGAVHVLHASLTGVSTRWGWGMTLVGVAISTWGNVASAPQSGISAGIVHAVPPLALAAMVEATMRIIRHGITVGAAAQTPTSSSTPASAATAPTGQRPAPTPVPPTPPAPATRPAPSKPRASDLAATASSARVTPAAGGAAVRPTTPALPTEPVPEPVRREVVPAPALARPEPSSARTATAATPPLGLRAVPTPTLPAELEDLAAWVRAEISAGQTASAQRAVDAGIAASLSTAKRRLRALRDLDAAAFEAVPVARDEPQARVAGA